MKILLLNQTYYPDTAATGQQLKDLAEHLVGQGHQVSVITAKRGYTDAQAIYSKYERYHGVEIHRVGSTGFGKGRVRWRLADALTFLVGVAFKLLKFPSQDIVVSFTSPPLIGFLGTLFCLFKGGRSVQWLMDINPDMAYEVGYLKRSSLVAHFLDRVFDFTLSHSSSIVVLDKQMKQHVMTKGVSAEKITIISPWSSHVERVEEKPRHLNVFRRLHGLQDKFVILYSGNHSIVHPLDTVLEAAKSLKSQSEILFLFIGSGARVTDVREFATENALNNIMQLPHQPREVLPDSLAAADIHLVVMGENMSGLVHPSKVYGILAVGKPFIFVGPKQSHVADLLKECPVGYAVEHGDVAGFLSAVEKLMSLDLSDREKIAQTSWAYLSAKYSKKISIRAFHEGVLGEAAVRDEEVLPKMQRAG